MRKLLPLTFFSAALAVGCGDNPAPAEVDAGGVDAPLAKDVPVALDRPATMDVGVAMDVPPAPDVPARPDAPVAPDVPARPDVPVAPDVPMTLDVPAVPDVPATPDVPTTPDAPDAPDVLDVPDVPDVPMCPTGSLLCGGSCVVSNLANCGACGNVCPAPIRLAPTCVAGACGYGACDTGFGNCDTDATNGCEADLATSVAHCGACGTACAAGQVCRSGACRTPRHASFVFAPGAGTVHVYSPTANALRVALDVGAATPTALPPMAFAAAGVRSDAVPAAGVLRLDGDAPFVAWVHDGASGDKIVAAGALDGSLVSTDLYTWSAGQITVLTGASAPSSVVVQRVSDNGGAGVTIDTWAAPSNNGFHVVATPTSAVYRVTSVGAPVTAFGQMLGETYNHFAYVPADEGTLRGTGFRYAEPVGAPGVRRMMVQSLEGAANVTFTVGAVVTMRALPGAVMTASVDFPANALITATSTAPAIAWIEADPGSPSDGSLLDADLVPSLRGRTYDTEWTFRTNIATATGNPDRRSDIDAIAFSDDTRVQLFAAGATAATTTVTINRGQRARLLTDATPDAYVRVVTSQPALVEHSHLSIQFALRAPSITTYE